MKSILFTILGLAFVFQVFAQDASIDSVFSVGIPVKTIDARVLNEVSGLAFGKSQPGIIYVHNDSGGEPKVYMLDSLGNVIGDVELLGATNRDWEDIAVGPGKYGESNVYVAEIGDNVAQYETIRIYRFAEPIRSGGSVKITPERIDLTYPNGAMDAETLMVDPVSGDIFILSKRDKENTLFRLPAEKFQSGSAELEELMKLPITSSVAGDISQDGSQIIIKNYLEVFYWKRKKGESVMEALSRAPVIVPYVPEPQGEAIGFSPEGKSFFTLSEVRFGIQPVLYRYPKN